MLPEQNAAGYTPAQVMMTLASIAYDATAADMIADIGNPDYATGGQWNIVWGPVVYDGDLPFYTDNLMFIAQEISSQNYAVVIRGTVLDAGLSTLIDLYEDLQVEVPSQWTYPTIDGACIAGGTQLGLDILTGMVNESGQAVVDYLQSIKNATIYVTGHSLGGCLASVIAPYLVNQLIENTPVIIPYTFAAPTAGNDVFANWYTDLFASGAGSYRYYNEIDAIPMAWANLSGITNLYSDSLPCPWALQAVIDLVNDMLSALSYFDGMNYVQPDDTGTSFTGALFNTQDWFTEMANQHYHNTYLKGLGAPLIPNSTQELVPKKVQRNPKMQQPSKPVTVKGPSA